MDVDEMKHEEPHKEETPEEASEREAAIQKIQENGRLFLRNLSYTATEEDLRPLFEAFGPLKDVSILPSSFCFCFAYAAPLQRMRIPLDRDI